MKMFKHKKEDFDEVAAPRAETAVSEEPPEKTRRRRKNALADHPQAQPVFVPKRPDLNGFKGIRENTCHDCGETLSEDGRFGERVVDDGRKAYPVAVCVPCKKAHIERTK